MASTAKRHGESKPAIYAWRKKFGDLKTDEILRLKTLETESLQLPRLLVDRDF